LGHQRRPPNGDTRARHSDQRGTGSEDRPNHYRGGSTGESSNQHDPADDRNVERRETGRDHSAACDVVRPGIVHPAECGPVERPSSHGPRPYGIDSKTRIAASYTNDGPDSAPSEPVCDLEAADPVAIDIEGTAVKKCPNADDPLGSTEPVSFAVAHRRHLTGAGARTHCQTDREVGAPVESEPPLSSDAEAAPQRLSWLAALRAQTGVPDPVLGS